MDRLKALEIFKAVAERSSFVRAADALDLSTAVVTRAVKDLEKLLGVRLLHRSTRRVTLTAEGQAALERADALLRSFDELAAASGAGADEVAGDIRLGAPASFDPDRLAGVLAAFMERHPQVRVDLRLDDSPVDLVEHGADLALNVAWEPPASSIARRIGDLRVGLFAAPGYLRRMGAPKHPDELRRHDCVVYVGGGRRPWRFSHPVTGQIIEPALRARVSANNARAVLAAAVHGAGLAQLPYPMAEAAVRKGALQPVLSHWGSPMLCMSLVYHSRHLPARVRALIDHLAHCLAPQTEPVPDARYETAY
jgi:DNA-binding transcriptional LysR family regulator